MNVRIYKPSKNAMQSGRGGAACWVLEYETETPRNPESLMGWTSSEDTLGQVRLKFDSCEDAVRFAKEKGWMYEITQEQKRAIKPRNYADNFKYIPPEKQERA